MIGHHLIGMTLVVNIAMRWPYLVPMALVATVSAGFGGLYEWSAPTVVAKAPQTIPASLAATDQASANQEPASPAALATQSMGVGPPHPIPVEATIPAAGQTVLAVMRKAPAERTSRTRRAYAPLLSNVEAPPPPSPAAAFDIAQSIPGPPTDEPVTAVPLNATDSDSDDSPGVSQLLPR